MHIDLKRPRFCLLLVRKHKSCCHVLQQRLINQHIVFGHDHVPYTLTQRYVANSRKWRTISEIATAVCHVPYAFALRTGLLTDKMTILPKMQHQTFSASSCAHNANTFQVCLTRALFALFVLIMNVYASKRKPNLRASGFCVYVSVMYKGRHRIRNDSQPTE